MEDRRLILGDATPVEAHPDHPADGLEILPGSPDYHLPTEGVDEADWAGRDHAGCLIFCRHGKLFRRIQGQHDYQIADFNGLRPNPQPAPDWAKEPLTRDETKKR